MQCNLNWPSKRELLYVFLLFEVPFDQVHIVPQIKKTFSMSTFLNNFKERILGNVCSHINFQPLFNA